METTEVPAAGSARAAGVAAGAGGGEARFAAAAGPAATASWLVFSVLFIKFPLFMGQFYHSSEKATAPGNGLAQHPFLFTGEWDAQLSGHPG